ncbi:MAG: c-type cytochrome [Labilithrix sp.]|nr:c-type cytochrome [Labilithrix sp.]
MGRARLLALGLAALTLGASACKETTLEDRPCPPEGTTLTYESFGEGFMDAHCQSCHGAPTKDRKGAPSGYDFATVEDVRRWRSRIFSRAAADNTTMPPGPDDPPEGEREKLAEWLACGAP